MLYPQDFFIRHRQLRESAEKVLCINIESDFIFSGPLHLYINDFFYKRRKLLRSKSKQSRIMSVVCK